jgi:hypothetical protein
MSSSISSSKKSAGVEPSSFFVRGLVLIAITIAVTLALGHAATHFHHPQPLGLSVSDVSAADHLLVAFGNSRFYSNIDFDILAKGLSTPRDTVKAIDLTGGQWDSLHFYMLALLTKDMLRPGRDAVLIEVSPLSENDNELANHLGAIRPSVALRVAEVPGTPIETRLDILLGASADLYRYRGSIQYELILPKLDHVADRAGTILNHVGLEGPPIYTPPFSETPAPMRKFVVKEIQGDVNAYLENSRDYLLPKIQTLQFGGFKFAALERAVRAIRDRNIAVYLVQTPTSRWLREQLNQTKGGHRFLQEIPQLAARTGAVLLDKWPETAFDQNRYSDDMHLFFGANGMDYFTALLAQRLSEQTFIHGTTSRSAHSDSPFSSQAQFERGRPSLR